MAKTMAVEAQCWASSSHMATTSANGISGPPRERGTRTPRAPSARSASIASTGNRALRSTSSAWTRATAAPTCATRATQSERWAPAVAAAAVSFLTSATRLELADGLVDRGDAGEHRATQHPIGELHVELCLEGQH